MSISLAGLSRERKRDRNRNTNICGIAATAKRRFRLVALRHFSFD
jgi:hypothetical protein